MVELVLPNYVMFFHGKTFTFAEINYFDNQILIKRKTSLSRYPFISKLFNYVTVILYNAGKDKTGIFEAPTS